MCVCGGGGGEKEVRVYVVHDDQSKVRRQTHTQRRERQEEGSCSTAMFAKLFCHTEPPSLNIVPLAFLPFLSLITLCLLSSSLYIFFRF